ncbi:uncharacterized protein [Miscanthus floridulus]|uniref:uncharacterized protein isoform X2 n=1 Tax=Miscanthus floridulus TaxID=154761 RepID=UPI00345A6DFB
MGIAGLSKLIGKSRGLSSDHGCLLGHTALLLGCFSEQHCKKFCQGYGSFHCYTVHGSLSSSNLPNVKLLDNRCIDGEALFHYIYNKKKEVVLLQRLEHFL